MTKPSILDISLNGRNALQLASKTCEDVYKKVHAAVIANPDRVKAKGNSKPTKKIVAQKPRLVMQDSKGRKWLRHFRLTTQQRNERSKARLLATMKAAHAAMGN